MLLRNMEVVSIFENQGNKFNKQALDLFANVRSGDELILFDISFGNLDNEFNNAGLFKLHIK